MTYIEFYDKDITENICTSLFCLPERVILVGDKMKLLMSQAERYRNFFENRGQSIEFVCRSVNKNNPKDVIKVLTEIISEYNDCVFELTGGEEVYLTSAGIVAERFREKNVKLNRFNIRTNTIQRFDPDGNSISEKKYPELSVEENIFLYGGAIIYEDSRNGSTYKWEVNSEFSADVDYMWDLCRVSPKEWNRQLSALAVAERLSESKSDVLDTVVPFNKLDEALSQSNLRNCYNERIINNLIIEGIITVDNSNGMITVKYKNSQVKRCLLKAGQILEMKVFLSALQACDKDGNRVYNDVMTGVCIDWDGEIHSDFESTDTENEIDVMMMHGLIPVFVSCKNGIVTMDELYKLNTVATRFGGKYSKKAVVITSLEKNSDFERRFTERAEEMGIKIIDNICQMEKCEAERVLGSLWNNQ